MKNFTFSHRFSWQPFSVVFDMGYFRRGRAKLRGLPQIVLGINSNLGIFVMNVFSTFWIVCVLLEKNAIKKGPSAA